MIQVETLLRQALVKAAQELYQCNLSESELTLNHTPEQFEGHFTVVVFPIAKLAKAKPEEVAQALGEYLKANFEEIADFNVANKGFCNLVVADSYWRPFLQAVLSEANFGQAPKNGQKVVLEYSSPNTNKPLHLGHIRNNLLGYATANILQAAGYEVKKVQIINDRGIHICKSMLAWQRFGQGETPESSGLKGDHLVGKYYVRFEQEFQAEYKAWQSSPAGLEALETWKSQGDNLAKAEKSLAKARQKEEEKAQEEGREVDASKFAVEKYFFSEVYKNTYFNSYSKLGLAAKQMLQDWEEGKTEVIALWAQMNSWVYAGFEQTYQNLGVNFDKLYYESETYLLGKKLVEDELNQGEKSVFYRKDDGSVWIDLSAAKLDQKAVLRSDGTSMYITQDLGTALARFQDFDMDRMIYVVGNEQEYHFQVLFEILKRLGYKFSENCYHLSYGMVNLTTGRMKSREGTVVDADDLMAQLVEAVRVESEERATLEGLPQEEKAQIWQQVALGALKYFILKVDAPKSMIFDPQQSVDLQGNTGPYIQNAYVRTQAVQRKAAQAGLGGADYSAYALEGIEREVLSLIQRYPGTVVSAAKNYNPAELANYLYTLAKSYHRLWNEVYLLDPQRPEAVAFRLDLSRALAQVLAHGGGLLGITMPERM